MSISKYVHKNSALYFLDKADHFINNNFTDPVEYFKIRSGILSHIVELNRLIYNNKLRCTPLPQRSIRRYKDIRKALQRTLSLLDNYMNNLIK